MTREELRSTMSYVIFGIGIGNLGRTRQRRVPAADLVTRINERLQVQSCPARIACSFGHTGNFVACCETPVAMDVVAQVRGALGFDATVLAIADIKSVLRDISVAMEPPREPGFRWTAGIAFHVSGPLSDMEVKSTQRAVLWRISPNRVGIWKRDIETLEGGLDRNSRGGGWGAVAGEIGKQVGGRWTARSLRTVIGIARKADALI